MKSKKRQSRKKAIIQQDGQDVQLNLIHPIYRTKQVIEKDRNGVEHLTEKNVLVKEMRVKRWFHKSSIGPITEYITSDHKIAKARCVVFDKTTSQAFTVSHSPEEIREAIKTRHTAIVTGFRPR